MRRVRLLNISTPFQGLDHDVTLLASGHWMYSGPIPQAGDGTLYGSMLTYNILMNLKPVLNPLPDNELCLLIDVPLGLYVSMDWTNGFEFQIYEDPNAIPGIQSALTATGLAAAFVGASGGLELPLHNLVPFKDMSQWTDSGTAVGAYGAISGLGGSGNYIYKHTTLDVPNGTKIALVTKLKGTNGERTTVEITTTGANTVAAGVDLDGTEQTIVTPLTLNADATRVDARIGQNSDGNAASDVEVLGAWLYFETYGLGAWPMQNLAGFTIDNLPEDLTYGLGVVYNKETGLPDHLGLGAEYRNLVNNPLFVGGTVGILGAGGVLPEGVDLTSETGAEIHRLSDDEMEITVWREAVGQKAYPRIRLSDHLLDAVTPGQSMVGQIEIEVVTNDSAAGVVRASVDFRNKGSYVGDGFVTPDLAVGSSGHYAEIVTVPATSDTGGLSVQVPSTVQDGDTDTVRLIIKRPQLVNNSNIIGLPLIPSIPGGQDTHAAQPFYGDISTFAKLEPDLYSALGQSGAIGTGGSPWSSDTGEGRFSVVGNVITLSPGIAAERITVFASPLGLQDGDVVEIDYAMSRLAGNVALEEPSTANGTNFAQWGSTHPSYSGKHQVVVEHGRVMQIHITGGVANAAGTIAISIRKVQQGEWTIAAGGRSLIDDASAQAPWARIVSLSDGSSITRASILMNNSIDKLWGETRTADVGQAGGDGGGSVISVDGPANLSLSAAEDQVQAAANGVASALDTTAVMGNYTTLAVLTADTGAAEPACFKVQRLVLMSRETTTAELLQLAPAKA
ncbi:MAG: hypothetical protein JJ894_03120 [Dinoroseobacter sp.]|nr:hypothetical protein [Dinoroseobacter sp.]